VLSRHINDLRQSSNSRVSACVSKFIEIRRRLARERQYSAHRHSCLQPLWRVAL